MTDADRQQRAEDSRKRVPAVFDWLQEPFARPDYDGCGWIDEYGELGGTSETAAREVRRHEAGLRGDPSGLVAGAGGSRSTADAIFVLAEGATATAAIERSPEAGNQARRAAQALLGS